MKIGLVSKLEHCKPHAKALMDRGHEVVCLGTDKVDFPASFDVFVCRPDSVSHQAFWDASNEKKNGREVIFENSVTKIVKAIQRLEEDVRREQEAYSRDANKVASVLQDALEPNPLTVEKKLIAAIKEVGIYHPRLEITPEQLQALMDMGLIKSLPRAREAYHMASMINPTSWQRPFNNIRRSPSFYTYRMWKVSDTEGRMKIKTPLEMAAPAHIPQKTLEKVAKLFQLHTVEPAEGRAWPPSTSAMDEVAPLPVSPVMQAAAGETMGDGSSTLPFPVKPLPVAAKSATEPKIEIKKVEPARTPVEPEAVSAEHAVLDAPVPAAVPQMTISKHKVADEVVSKPKVTPKSDIRDLLSMLNDALLALNVETITIRPGANGPTYQLEQRVIRKVSSIDDLE